jgi:hypothetical protein
MLRPHYGEDAELDERRLSTQQLLYPLIFVLSEVVSGDDVWGDHAQLRTPITLSIANLNSPGLTRPKCLNATCPLVV